MKVKLLKKVSKILGKYKRNKGMAQMTKVEEKVVRYAESVNWDYISIHRFIFFKINEKQQKMIGGGISAIEKTDYIIKKFKPKMETKTKVTVLGEEPKKDLNKIELLYHTTADGHVEIQGENSRAKWWDNIILIEPNYKDGLDLILGYNNRYICGLKCRSLMLGHWNDGIV